MSLCWIIQKDINNPPVSNVFGFKRFALEYHLFCKAQIKTAVTLEEWILFTDFFFLSFTDFCFFLWKMAASVHAAICHGCLLGGIFVCFLKRRSSLLFHGRRGKGSVQQWSAFQHSWTFCTELGATLHKCLHRVEELRLATVSQHRLTSFA